MINKGYSGNFQSQKATEVAVEPNGFQKNSSKLKDNKFKIAAIFALWIVAIIIIAVVAWFVTRKVDGSFSSWSNYGPCSKTCGGGTRSRTRKCDNPTPKNGGKKCDGPYAEVGFCANTICPGSAGISMTQQLVQDIMLNYHAKLNATKDSSGRFQKSIFAMQREVANEQAFEYLETNSSRSRRDLSSASIYEKKRTLDERLDDMKKIIKISVNRTSKDFARSIFAKSLFIFIKKQIRDGTPISEISKAADGYLEWIKKDIGEQNFDELILASGGATLMFTIDTTGSMSEEINAAKAIAISIINRKRQFPVDYILSPFNDPGAGPVTYRSPEDKEDFVNAIRRLSARGGGDCPELTFTGMLNALQEEPQIGSPMFVFTDATAKDGTSYMIKELKKYAEYFSTTINFFFKNSCGSGVPNNFQDIASHTSGQIFPLKTDREIEKFKDYVEDSLADSVIIKEGKDGSDLFITLDGEITTLLLSLEVKQAGQAQYVKLVDPVGRNIIPILTTTYTCIFKVLEPFPGTWHLKYPAGIDIKSYVAKSAGNNTIDFRPYFLHTEREDEVGPVLSIPQPVKGKNTTAMLQVSGAKLLDYESLLMDIISETGKLLQSDINVIRSGGGKAILKGKIQTSNQKFKIKLKGKTTDGQNFTRVSQLSFEESDIVMITIRAGNDYSASVRNSTVPIKVYFFSNAFTTNYQLTASSSYGSVAVDPSRFQLAKGTNKTITLTHTLPFNAPLLVGKVVTIKLSAGSNSINTKFHGFQMLYVP